MTHVIVLPGGGYWTLVENEGEPVADWVRSSIGLNASVFRYTLNRPHPEPLLAVRERVVELRHEGVETIGLIGFSAGGHLAGQAALAPSDLLAERIDFVVLGYPVTSMELDTYRPSQDILLGSNPTAAARRHTSLEYLATAQAPPFFLWHTAEDVNVPAVHTYRLAAALNEHQIRIQCTCSPTVHTCSAWPTASPTSKSGPTSQRGGSPNTPTPTAPISRVLKVVATDEVARRRPILRSTLTADLFRRTMIQNRSIHFGGWLMATGVCIVWPACAPPPTSR